MSTCKFILSFVLIIGFGGIVFSHDNQNSRVHSYVPRWHNYDGLSFEEHARIMHGIDTRGMSRDQIARLRDSDHDKYGGGHPNFLKNLPNRKLNTYVNPAPKVKVDNKNIEVDVGSLHVKVVPNKSVKIYRSYPSRPLLRRFFR